DRAALPCLRPRSARPRCRRRPDRVRRLPARRPRRGACRHRRVPLRAAALGPCRAVDAGRADRIGGVVAPAEGGLHRAPVPPPRARRPAMSRLGAAIRRNRALVWPSVFAGGAFLVLLGLGTWQVERLFWKERLIAERHAAVTGAPIALPPSLDAARPLEYHRVRVSGRLANDHELYL